MKTCFSFLTWCVLTLPAWAQLSSLPPLSGEDGIYLRPTSSPLENSSWSSSALSSYRMSADNSFTTPANGAWDTFGQKWTSLAPDRTRIANGGGTLRGIVLGTPGAVPHALGYSYSGTLEASDAYTLAYHSSETSPAFGDRADIRLSPGDAASFDFWVCTPSGAYTLFGSSNRDHAPGIQAEVLWTEAPLLIPTFIPALNNTALVETWIVSIVELGNPSETRSEFRFGFQQFPIQGSVSNPPSGTPVPEPSTYVLAGAALCGVLIIRRTVRRR